VRRSRQPLVKSSTSATSILGTDRISSTIVGRTDSSLRLAQEIDYQREAAMFFSLFRKSKTVICAVCGKAIAPKDRRFVDRNRVTKAERHTHVGCQRAAH
jgi:hypothetical protein